jgi:hypothetical protein
MELGAGESVLTCRKLLETTGAALCTDPGHSVSFEGAVTNNSVVVEVLAEFPCRRVSKEVNTDKTEHCPFITGVPVAIHGNTE